MLTGRSFVVGVGSVGTLNPGDDRRRQAHDELENVMDDALKSAGVRTWTKGNTTARLARGLPAGQGLDHYTPEPSNGNVPRWQLAVSALSIFPPLLEDRGVVVDLS